MSLDVCQAAPATEILEERSTSKSTGLSSQMRFNICRWTYVRLLQLQKSWKKDPHQNQLTINIDEPLHVIPEEDILA
ncbi:hypothetical protein AVEN_85198-1 [Araneus ventricosus]|uniref:Uncharacterized protein n=1 Tax=Araneus ventricosus TaxID=182803 RepID=A0A4Y2HLJ5_ARAVE|nr:hypothetical protein AVEN_192222-1 [Araneus ventricosus]GBM66223.1 hypothetical protein AVEN_234616-1 [Araneus ventricosus]GBM66322.1 hypothetical protein AVEN_82871-1 [Araneus ventricosus]GBM66335.1 hypothetical protein AVEN_85198-1 [Araneus ventricosus]